MPVTGNHDDAEQLNRLWDQFLEGSEERADEAGWLASFEAISAAATRPEADPNAAFVAALRQRLLATARSRNERQPSRMRSPLGVVHPALLPSAPLFGRLAIAAVLALILAGAIAVGHWLPPSDNAPIVASALASSIPGTAAPAATPTVFLGTAIAPAGDPVTRHASPTVASYLTWSSGSMSAHATGSVRTQNRAPHGD
jgi:hypothetical protein